MSISDYEYLYMIRQNDLLAMDVVLNNYRSLLWKRAHDFVNQQRPHGVSVDDMFQEGAIGFHEAIYSFLESMNVGFAHYVSICVESSIRTALRKCRGKSYMLLDGKTSLDMTISEDGSLYLYDVIETQDIHHNPMVMSHYFEARRVEYLVLSSLDETERMIYTMRMEGYSYREISSLTHKTVKYVDNVIQKVRRKLNQAGSVGHS